MRVPVFVCDANSERAFLNARTLRGSGMPLEMLRSCEMVASRSSISCAGIGARSLPWLMSRLRKEASENRRANKFPDGPS